MKVILKRIKEQKEKGKIYEQGKRKECGWVVRRVAGRLNSPNELRFMKNNPKRCLVTCRTNDDQRDRLIVIDDIMSKGNMTKTNPSITS